MGGDFARRKEGEVRWNRPRPALNPTIRCDVAGKIRPQFHEHAMGWAIGIAAVVLAYLSALLIFLPRKRNFERIRNGTSSTWRRDRI